MTAPQQAEKPDSRSDAERILYAVIDGETGFASVADVRAFIQNEWKADRGLERESAQSALVVEAADGLPGSTDRFLVMVADEAGRWHSIDETGNFVMKYAVEEMEASQAKFPDDRYRIAIKRTSYIWPTSTTNAERSPDSDLLARLAEAESLIATLTEAIEEAVTELEDLAFIFFGNGLTADQFAHDVVEAKQTLRRALAAVVVEQPPDGQGAGGDETSPVVEVGEGG